MADTSQSILRRLRDIRDNPRGVLEQLRDQLQNFNKGRVAEINDNGAGYRSLSTNERAKQFTQGALDNFGSGGLGALGVIKARGGQWLTDSVDEALRTIKLSPVEQQMRRTLRANPYADTSPEALSLMRSQIERRVRDATPREAAIDNWIDSVLGRYVKRDMATPQDPIRLLADQGITHIPEVERVNFRPEMWGKETYRPEQQWLANSPQAKVWEGFADDAIKDRIAAFHRNHSADYPGKKLPDWVNDLPGNERVFEMHEPQYFAEDAGFKTMVAEINDAMQRKDLPDHLRLKPEDLQQMGMEKMIRHLYGIREHELAAKRALREGLPVVKEFDDGMRWIELNKPGSFAAESDAMGHSVRGYEPPMESPDWVEASGDSGLGALYGHGGWEAIKSGRARVMSLVDKQGKPKITLEFLNHNGIQSKDTLRSKFAEDMGDLTQEAFEKEIDKIYRNQFKNIYQYMAENDAYPKLNNDLREYFEKLGDDMPSDDDVIKIMAEKFADHQDIKEPRLSITQVKGNSNLAPDKQYHKHVQELSRELNAPITADHSNAGLYELNGRYLTEEELHKAMMNGDFDAMKAYQHYIVDGGDINY